MSIGILTLHIQLPGCGSLKEKRSRIKPLLARLHREFNISVAEVDFLDAHQDALLNCSLVSNDARHTRRVLMNVSRWIETHWHDVSLVDDQIELL